MLLAVHTAQVASGAIVAGSACVAGQSRSSRGRMCSSPRPQGVQGPCRSQSAHNRLQAEPYQALPQALVEQVTPVQPVLAVHVQLPVRPGLQVPWTLQVEQRCSQSEPKPAVH